MKKDYLAIVDACVADEMIDDEDNRSENVFILADVVRELVAENAELIQFIKDDALSRIRMAVGNVEVERDDALEVIAQIRALHSPGKPYFEPNGGATITPCQECDDDMPCATARLLP